MGVSQMADLSLSKSPRPVEATGYERDREVLRCREPCEKIVFLKDEGKFLKR